MLERCKQAVRAAAKAHEKTLTDADLKRIEDRLTQAVKRLERTDPKWASYSREERMRLAAYRAGADIRADGARVATNLREQITAQADLQAIEARMAEMRPDGPKPAPITGKLFVDREQAAAKEAREEFYRADAALYAATSWTRDLVPDAFVAAGQLAARALGRLATRGVAQRALEKRDFAALKVRAAEQRAYIARLQAEPYAAPPFVSPPERVAIPAGLPDSPELQMATRLAGEMPDLPVTLPGSDEQILMRDVLARIEAEHKGDAQWAELVRAAAECALTS